MKKILIASLGLLLIATSCNNSSESKETTPSKSAVDSLEDEVWDGHDVGMAKYGKLRSMKLRAEQVLDSISKLPAKAREAAAPLKARLDSLVADLSQAKEDMDAWMSGFNRDSFADNVENRIRYLTDEKLKINRIKENILNGLERADSLLKAK
jgi:hypothetical protein